MQMPICPDSLNTLLSESEATDIFAYLDQLALGAETADSFLLSRLENLKAQLKDARSLNERLYQLLLWRQTGYETRALQLKLRAQAGRACGNKPDSLDLLIQINASLRFLLAKFYLSRQFYLFKPPVARHAKLGQKAASCKAWPKVDGRALANEIWLQYLATVNIEDMGEILAACDQLTASCKELPHSIQAYFSLAAPISAYFWAVIHCLDSIASLKPANLALLASAGQLYGVESEEYGRGLEQVHQAGATLLSLLRRRREIFKDIYAMVYASCCDQSLDLTENMLLAMPGAANGD